MASTETSPIVTTLYAAKSKVIPGTTTTINNGGGATRFVSSIVVTKQDAVVKRSRVLISIDGTEVLDITVGDASFQWNSGNGATFAWANGDDVTVEAFESPAAVSILAFEATP
jgi:hypothetical protein